MTMEEKVLAVEAVLGALDEKIQSFQNATGLHCKWGCGKCCYKADIEATVLEFLPFGLHLYRNGLAFDWLEQLKTDSPICVILNPTQAGAGLCSQYKYRGLICRLFGYSARTNKYGHKELVTCQIIKTEQAVEFAAANAQIAAGVDVPVMSNFYMQLHAIDFQMAQEFFPINEAIKRAIEAILHHYAYRD